MRMVKLQLHIMRESENICTIESYVTCCHTYVTQRHNISNAMHYECDIYLSGLLGGTNAEFSGPLKVVLIITNVALSEHKHAG